MTIRGVAIENIRRVAHKPGTLRERAVFDGRPELTFEFQASEPNLRDYVAEKFRALLKNSSFLDALPAHLLPDAASQARASLLMARMTQIESMGSTQN